jgi:hypothetical protein
MASNWSLAQEASLVTAMALATDAAGRTGSYVTLKNAHKAFLVFHIHQGNAATIALSVEQATAVAGTSAKALSVVRWWACINESSSDVLVRQTDGASYTTDAGTQDKIVVAEIDPGDLEMANSFITIAPVTGASNVANLTSCIAMLTPMRYAADQPPTAIAN